MINPIHWEHQVKENYRRPAKKICYNHKLPRLTLYQNDLVHIFTDIRFFSNQFSFPEFSSDFSISNFFFYFLILENSWSLKKKPGYFVILKCAHKPKQKRTNEIGFTLLFPGICLLFRMFLSPLHGKENWNYNKLLNLLDLVLSGE